MMELYRKFVDAATEPRMAYHTWQRDRPYRQPYFAYSPSSKRWQAVSPPSEPPGGEKTVVASADAAAASTAGGSSNSGGSGPLTGFTVYSWNIDFMLPHGDLRLTAALDHIHSLLVSSAAAAAAAAGPVVIFLQEMTNADLRVIQAQPWVRAGFFVTDVSNAYWESDTFGTCTLISRSLKVRDVFRVHYSTTRMQRDGLFVDIDVDVDVDVDIDSNKMKKVVRLCNTHLESLALEPPMRPGQMACAAGYMHASPPAFSAEEERADGEDNDHTGAEVRVGVEVVASVLGGDLNAVQEFDPGLAAENGLEDAHVVTTNHVDQGRGHNNANNDDNDDNGFTWGQMARTSERRKYGLCRMDKLLFCGGVSVQNFERFGMGVEVAESHDLARRELVSLGLEKPWVTDHLGVRGDFSLLYL